MSKLSTYFKLLRVDNYVKNLFIFAPLFFDFQFDIYLIAKAVIAFILFCFLASGVYVFNDIVDLDSDRKHPVKRFRPLASGLITVKKGGIIGATLIVLSLSIAYLFNLDVFYVLFTYLVINVLYNLSLKRIPVIDVIVISCCFVIRILVGSFATEIPPSYWILTITFLLAMFLGFSKRRADIICTKNGGEKNKNIGVFTLKSINITLSVFAVMICIMYFIYTIDAEVIANVGTSLVFLTNIFVMLGVARYLFLLKSSDTYKDPTAIVVSDRKLQFIIFLWVLSFLLIKYI